MTRNLNQNQGPFEDIFQSLQASPTRQLHRTP